MKRGTCCYSNACTLAILGWQGKWDKKQSGRCRSHCSQEGGKGAPASGLCPISPLLQGRLAGRPTAQSLKLGGKRGASRLGPLCLNIHVLCSLQTGRWDLGKGCLGPGKGFPSEGRSNLLSGSSRNAGWEPDVVLFRAGPSVGPCLDRDNEDPLDFSGYFFFEHD